MIRKQVRAACLLLYTLSWSVLSTAQVFADTALHASAEDSTTEAVVPQGDEAVVFEVESDYAVPGGYADVYIHSNSHDKLEKLDLTMSWGSSAITTYGINSYSGALNVETERTSTSCHAVITPNTSYYSQKTTINDTDTVMMQLHIPLDAKPGTEYLVMLTSVDCFQLSNGTDIASSIKTGSTATITVLEPETSGYCGYGYGDGSNYNKVEWNYDKASKTLTISGTGNMAFYKSPEFVPWYSFTPEIEKVIIKEGVTSIGGNAFVACSALTDVEIADSVIDVDFEPFDTTPWFETLKAKSDTVIVNDILMYASGRFSKGDVIIPDGVKSIAALTFCDNPNITSITMPDSVQFISRLAFISCENLHSVSFGNRLSVIEEEAFKSCTALEKIDFPDSLLRVGHSGFAECDHLRSVTFGKNMQTIDIRAFQNCSALETVSLPDSVLEIGNGAFEGTPLLENQSGVKYVGGFVVDCDSDVTSAAIQPGTKEIADRAFENAGELNLVILPDSLTTIQYGAFSNCKQLNEITIPKSVVKIQKNAFYYCDTLERIIILNPYCEIGDEAIVSDYDFKTSTAHFTGTIYGYDGSTARVYAEKYGYAFQSLGEAPPLMSGDVNADGEVTVADVVLLQKWLLTVPGTRIPNPNAADLYKDGILDVYDLCFMKRLLTAQ